jgi:hypothetical protein
VAARYRRPTLLFERLLGKGDFYGGAGVGVVIS